MNNLMKILKTFIIEVFGFAVFAVISFIMLFINKPAGIVALVGLIIYAIALVAYVNIKKHRLIGVKSAEKLIPSAIKKIDAPFIMVSEDNTILWCNNEFVSMSEISGTNPKADKIFDGSLSYASLANAYDTYLDFIPLNTEGSYYEVHVSLINNANQKIYGALLYRKDNEIELKKRITDTSIRVAYIVIDNTNEVTQEVQENRRFGSATVNKLLNEWAAEYSAILTEYDRDKYVMQFENRHLQTMISNKFDILDKVVEHSLDESQVPITISIGVSYGEGTLLEKRESAQAALRSALQRGGALAVVRTADGEDSYGGKTKAVQRQTKIRSRLCRDLLYVHLPKCSNVIIMGHSRPDYDSIASNIGIAKLVQAFDKEYCIVADKNDKSISKVIDAISQFSEYESVFVDAEYAQELLTPDTLVIITDASNPELFAAKGVYDNASKVVVIDHHAIKETLGDQVLQPTNIDPTASSASELVCEILELSFAPSALRPEEAQILMAGILLDTQFFSRDTGTRTYSACIFLKNAGAEAGKAKNLFKSDMNQFRSVSKIEQRMQVYKDKFVISTFNDNTNPENKVTASKAAENLVDIDGISASFVLYSLENGINLSARSDGTVNVINIAKMLGGGGHFQSAGALIKRSNGKEFTDVVFDIDEAEEILKKALDEYLSNSN